MAAMDQIAPIITKVKEYCDKANIKPSTLCVRVLGNSRFLDRLQRKVEKADEDARKLSAFMAENPPENFRGGQ